MKVYNNIQQLPVFKNAVLTIGTFDGVHLGHQQIIGQLLRESADINGTSVVITFFPHPKQVVLNESENGDISTRNKNIHLLNTPEEKYALLHAHGIEHVVVVPFNKDFAEQSAASYIENFLVKLFHPHTIIIGYDHRFGKNRAGDYELLESKAQKNGFVVKEIPEHVLEQITISSTKIREAILKGEVETAAKYLGYSYFFSGVVVKGNQLGRKIGFPTANLTIENEQKLIPANGVYAVQVEIEGNQSALKGMMNIGIRPTINGTDRVIEVNIFDFDEDIYSKTITVTLKKYLRGEVKFNGLEQLSIQLAKDKTDALKILQ
jgi:riboflavin kinase/FMN adenylyltransferase